MAFCTGHNLRSCALDEDCNVMPLWLFALCTTTRVESLDAGSRL